MATTLKDGSEVKDIRLGRVKEFDERNLQYPIRALTASQTPRSYSWLLKKRLDQGNTPACVGYSWTQELIARPKEILSVDGDFAYNTVYKGAQLADEWPGQDYEGTSVLGGAKTVQTLGFMKEYRWAQNVEDILTSVSRIGPGILGTNWLSGMMDTDANGFIHATGDLMGGHAILVRGVNLKGNYVTLANSWSASWGVGGDCKLSFDDLGKLLQDDGEFCIPVSRNKPAGY
jgi:hypothetical protein